jgi:hypothetical protein
VPVHCLLPDGRGSRSWSSSCAGALKRILEFVLDFGELPQESRQHAQGRGPTAVAVRTSHRYRRTSAAPLRGTPGFKLITKDNLTTIPWNGDVDRQSAYLKLWDSRTG